MAGVSDRNEISRLNQLPSRFSLPATSIPIPSHPKPSRNTQDRRIDFAAKGANPFGGRTYDTLSKTPGQRAAVIGNTVIAHTLAKVRAEPPKKRQRLAPQHRNEKPILANGVDEHAIVVQSSDELNHNIITDLTDPASSAGTSKLPGYREGQPLVHDVDNWDDPIEEADNTPPKAIAAVTPRNVLKLVDIFERKTVPTPKITRAMKGKAVASRTPVLGQAGPSDTTMATTHFKSKSQVLLIEDAGFILGLTRLSGPHHLSYDQKTLSIKHGLPGRTSLYEIKIELGDIVECESSLEADLSITLLKITTRKPPATSRVKPVPTRFAQYFALGGKDGMGDIYLKFDCKQEQLSELYSGLRGIMNKHTHTLTKGIRPKGAETVWNIAMEQVVIDTTLTTKEPVKEAPTQQPRSNGYNGRQMPKNRPATVIIVKPPPKRDDENERSRNEESDVEILGPVVRRSARQAPPEPKPPPVDMDEVILIYPSKTPGAVNITNGDVARLDPGGFLNDNLIEFGLKFWLRSDPGLAEKVHVFNSFFYKKLNDKKGLQAGYDSVKRWTTKIDIFDKEVIIVPINENLHWYLAVIYQPSCLLQPPPPPPPLQSPATRSRGRQSNRPKAPEFLPDNQDAAATLLDPQQEDEVSIIDVEMHHAEEFLPDNDQMEQDGNFGDGPSSETETRDLLTGTSSTCVVTPSKSVVPDDDASMRSSSPLTPDEDDELQLKSRDELPKATPRRHSPMSPVALSPTATEHDDSVEIPESTVAPDSEEIEITEIAEASGNGNGYKSIPPSRFYSSKSGKPGKAKRAREPAPPAATEIKGLDSDDEPPIVQEGVQDRTYIFTLDSLNHNHPKAMSVLSDYLAKEAKDKKSIENITAPIKKKGGVSVQDNFSDCGLFLLHFAKMFAREPRAFANFIVNPPKMKSATAREERDKQWDKVGLEDREVFRQNILEESANWKAIRKEEEKEKGENPVAEVVDDSDSDVSIVATVTATAPRKAHRIR